MFTWSVFAAITVLGGLGMGVIGAVVHYAHDGPGSTALVVTMLGSLLTGVSYGVNLAVFDPVVSQLIEVIFWFGSEVMVIGLIFFALAFTGRGEYLTRRNVILISAIPALTVLVAATNSTHGLLWQNYQLVETFGSAVRTFDRGPWLYIKSTYAFVIAGAAYLMFIEEMYVEETLYRNQSTAIVLGGVIPLTGYSVWMFELGPYPHVDSMSPLFVVSTVLYAYAVFYTDLFETVPAVRRIGRRDMIDQTTEPVFLLDTDGRVTDLNEAALELVDRPRIDALGTNLNGILDDSTIELAESFQSLTLRTAEGRREFETITNRMSESGETIGYAVLFYDVTDKRQRKQRLEVLNRILRHNLRNDMNTILGYVRLIRDTSSDEQINEWTEQIETTGEDLIALGEKAREFEAILDDDVNREPIDLADFVQTIAEQCREQYADATITAEIDINRAIETDRRLLRLILTNLVENAIEHHDGNNPQVTIREQQTDTDKRVKIEIVDNGPGIPEIELTTLRSGTEDPLQHSQGIGLWVVQWSVTMVGGTIAFDADEDGTTVTLELPTANESTQSAN